MRKAGLPLQKIFAGQALLELSHDLHYSDIESMYAAVGNGHISSQFVIEKLTSKFGIESDEGEEAPPIHHVDLAERSKLSSSGVDVEGGSDVLVKLARCCAPVPGDEIIGFITRGNGVSVHRSNCSNLSDLRKRQEDRLIKVKWNDSVKALFLVNIQVEALDRARLLSDLTKTLSDHQVNILNASVTTSKDRTALSRFTFEMADASHLDAVLASMRKVDGVYDVYRVTNN